MNTDATIEKSGDDKPERAGAQPFQERLAYYRANGGWEKTLLGLCRPLGEALADQKDQRGSLSLRDPKIKNQIKRLIPKIKSWHARYSDWRTAQGRPLRGRYQDLPEIRQPHKRIVAAAKEVGYRLSISEKDAARAALRDLVHAAEQDTRQRREKQQARQADEEAQERARQRREVAAAQE